MDYRSKFLTVYPDENGDIIVVEAGGNSKKLGIDNARERDLLKKQQELTEIQNEMQDVLENYFQKLTEVRKYLIEVYDDKEMVNQLAYFAPVKTPEEIAQEAAEEQIRIAQEQARQFRAQAEEQAKQFQEQSFKQMQVQEATLQALQNSNEMVKQLQSVLEGIDINGLKKNSNERNEGQYNTGNDSQCNTGISDATLQKSVGNNRKAGGRATVSNKPSKKVNPGGVSEQRPEESGQDDK